MRYDMLKLGVQRSVYLCGTNIYPDPEYHPDRILNCHDLLYIIEGEWAVSQGEETYLVQGGDAILLRAGYHHAGSKLCTPNTRTIFIHFSSHYEDRYSIEVGDAEKMKYLENDYALLPAVTSCGEAGSTMQRLMRKVVDIYWSDRIDKKRILSIILQHILCELAYIAQTESKSEENWYVQVVQMLRRGNEKMYSLEELARVAGISVRSLSGRFRQITGQSVYQYQLSIKLEMAGVALRSTTRPIHDIARMYGFSDAYQFSRLFKRKHNMSPRDYRKNNPVTSRAFREIVTDKPERQ